MENLGIFWCWIVGQFIKVTVAGMTFERAAACIFIYIFKYVVTSVPSPLTVLSGSSHVQSSSLFHSIPDHPVAVHNAGLPLFLFLAMANMNG